MALDDVVAKVIREALAQNAAAQQVSQESGIINGTSGHHAVEPADAAAPDAGGQEDAPTDKSATVKLMMPSDLHPATRSLVFWFAGALADKLYAAQEKYGYSDGWRNDNWMDECRQHLREHVKKGDPIDVAAYCAFLWHHNQSTAPAAPAPEAAELIERLRKFPNFFSVDGAHWLMGSEIDPLCLEAAAALDALKRERDHARNVACDLQLSFGKAEKQLAAARDEGLEEAALECDGQCVDCSGNGYIVEPVCCGHADKNGDCCGSPEPNQVQCTQTPHHFSASIRALKRGEGAG